MRFISAHKLTSYLMVYCAFFALALSGELSTVAVTLAFIAIGGSWFWEEPRVRIKRYAPAWAALSLLVLGYTILRAIMLGSDFLIAGVEYLLFLLVAKLFNRSACRDYLHVYVLTFLMLVAGTVLNPELTYGLFFLGYVVATTWALILFHLRREMEENFLLRHAEDRESEPVQVTRILNSRRIVGRRFFAGTAAVSLGVFAVAALTFLSIPRIGFGLFSQKRRAGISMAGFSDRVALGGHGTIRSDNTVLMRVKTDSPLRTQEVGSLYWRGVAFDVYREGEWQRSRAAPRTSMQTTYAGFNTRRYHLLYAQARAPADQLDARVEGAVRQEIYLEPISEDVLFGASMPLSFELTVRPEQRHARPRATHNDEMRFAHGAGIRYVAYSDVDRPDPERLRAAPARLPDGYQSYQQVPAEITPRVRSLAREITAGAATHYDRAVAIEQWLEDNLSYTLEMRSPGEQEPIDFFLFDRRQGHCEYFASAMTIMLRALGVPARNVNGFLGGEWNEYDEYIAVRASDAHSWVEVYFHGVGWVTFDPTPSSSAAQQGADDTLAGRMRRYLDTLRFQWFQWVIEYDIYRQMSLFRGMGDSVKSGGASAREVFTGARDWLVRHRHALGGVGLAGVLLAVAIVGWRRRVQGTGARRAREPMTAIYERAVASLARHGHGREPHTTPREHARALAERAAPGASALTELADLHYTRIYGGDHAPDRLERARELAAAIEQALREAPREDLELESRGRPG